MKNYVYIVGSDDVQIERAMNAIAHVDFQPIGFCIAEDLTPLPEKCNFDYLGDFETPISSIEFTIPADFLEAWGQLERSMRQVELAAKITAEDIQELCQKLNKLTPIELPEEKIFNYKPYQSKLSNPKHAGNNFKRSGFPTSGKLARGRI